MYNQLFDLQESIFKALAHSRRLEILHLLRDQELTVSQIYQMLDLPQANVSQHLQILRDRNIVIANKSGKEVTYKIAKPELLHIVDSVRELLFLEYEDANRELVAGLGVRLTDLVPLTHDPVCAMRISPKTAGFIHVHKGTQFYFCASGCLERFKENPEKYLASK